MIKTSFVHEFVPKSSINSPAFPLDLEIFQAHSLHQNLFATNEYNFLKENILYVPSFNHLTTFSSSSACSDMDVASKIRFIHSCWSFDENSFIRLGRLAILKSEA